MFWLYFSLFTLFTLYSLDNTFIELFIIIANLWLSNKVNNWYLLTTSGDSFSLVPWKKIRIAFFNVWNFNVFSIGLFIVLPITTTLFFFTFWHFFQHSAHLIEKKYSCTFEVGTCKNIQCFNSDIDKFLAQNIVCLIPSPRKQLSTKY